MKIVPPIAQSISCYCACRSGYLNHVCNHIAKTYFEILKCDFDSMNETQWVTAVLIGGANGEGNSMFYVPAKESALRSCS